MLLLDLKDISTPLQNKSILFQLLCSQAHTLILKRLGLLPSELFASEVSISSRLEVSRLLELEVADEATWAQVKVVLDNLNELLLGFALGGVVRLDVDREWLSNSNGI